MFLVIVVEDIEEYTVALLSISFYFLIFYFCYSNVSSSLEYLLRNFISRACADSNIRASPPFNGTVSRQKENGT